MKRVLIVSTTGMGDCLWGTPAIRAMKKTFPSLEIDLVVSKTWKSLFDFNPYLNQIYEYSGQWYLQPILGLKLLGRHYDAIYIFHSNRNFRRMLPWLPSVPIWTHQNHDWIPESYRMKISTNDHGIKKRLIMLEQFGVKPDGGQMEIFLDQADLDSSQKLLKEFNFTKGEYVYLNLGASVERKRWMVERFKELASRILKATSWNIILGGGPNDKNRAQQIAKELNTTRVMDVCSQPLMVNAGIISKAGLMVTSDTGPMHIGFAMSTPIVALFGTISPLGSGPYDIPDHLFRVITIDPESDDYVEEQDPGDLYFRCITVDQVWGKVEEMLAEKTSL
ncbi:MAG: glycosyltransferase family 9 protein [Nitrospinae bacterium]|nr:glycosyltransferase family 9 protein [Nitrospinota bacterium]